MRFAKGKFTQNCDPNASECDADVKALRSSSQWTWVES